MSLFVFTFIQIYQSNLKCLTTAQWTSQLLWVIKCTCVSIWQSRVLFVFLWSDFTRSNHLLGENIEFHSLLQSRLKWKCLLLGLPPTCCCSSVVTKTNDIQLAVEKYPLLLKKSRKFFKAARKSVYNHIETLPCYIVQQNKWRCLSFIKHHIADSWPHAESTKSCFTSEKQTSSPFTLGNLM